MKKQYFFMFIAAALLAAGCTSPEQDQKIRLFWLQQYTNLMTKSLGKMPRAAWPATAAPVRPAPRRAEPYAPVQTPPQPQMIDVTIETDSLPGKAPLADRKRMKRAWDAVQLSNQKTLDDINTAFGAQIKQKAFLITANTEKQLKKAAQESADFAAYFAQQRDLLTKQEQALTQLMTQNRHNIKKLRNTKTSL